MRGRCGNMSRYAFHRISYSTFPSDKLITHILIFILTFLDILLYRLVDLKSSNTALTARSRCFGEEYSAQADEAYP